MIASKLRIILPIVFAIVALDHLSKGWIVSRLSIGDEIAVWQGFFDIVHVRNYGSAFGFLAETHESFRVPFFYAVSVLALVFLGYYIAKTPLRDRATLAALGLILGGAIGNVSDRIARGSVVDFLSLHWQDKVWNLTFLGKVYPIELVWPAFNVADSAITVGVIWLLFASLRSGKS